MKRESIIALLLLSITLGYAQSPDSFAFLSRAKTLEDSISLFLTKFNDNRLDNICDLVEMENKLGYLYTNHHTYSEALKWHNSALSHMDGLYHNSGQFQFALSSTYNYFGIVYAEQNQPEIAANYYWKAYRIDTSDEIVLNNYIASLNKLAYERASNEDYIGADNYLSRVFEVLPDSLPERLLNAVSSSYNLKAYIYAYANDLSSAHNYIDKAINLTPLEPNVYDSKGEFYLMQNHESDAFKMWIHVYELEPDFYNTHQSKLNERITTRGFVDYIVDLESKLKFRDAKAMGALGSIFYRGLCNKDKNILLAEKYYRLGAELGDDSCQLWLGQILREKGQKKEALELFEKSGGQGQSLSAFFAGEMYENGEGTSKNMDKAKDWYELSIKASNPYASNAKNALKRLKLLNPKIDER